MRLARRPGTAVTATASASPAATSRANDGTGATTCGATPSWAVRNRQATRPQISPAGIPAAKPSAGHRDRHRGHGGADLGAGEAEDPQHHQVAQPAADGREQQMREGQHAKRAERQAEHQGQALQLPEVDQVRRRTRPDDHERPGPVQPGREIGRSPRCGDPRAELDQDAVGRRHRSGRRQEPAQAADREFGAGAEHERVVHRREDRGPDDPHGGALLGADERHRDRLADLTADRGERPPAQDDFVVAQRRGAVGRDGGERPVGSRPVRDGAYLGAVDLDRYGGMRRRPLGDLRIGGDDACRRVERAAGLRVGDLRVPGHPVERG